MVVLVAVVDDHRLAEEVADVILKILRRRDLVAEELERVSVQAYERPEARVELDPEEIADAALGVAQELELLERHDGEMPQQREAAREHGEATAVVGPPLERVYEEREAREGER
jgi:hypothetical protein